MAVSLWEGVRDIVFCPHAIQDSLTTLLVSSCHWAFRWCMRRPGHFDISVESENYLLTTDRPQDR